MKAGSLGDRVAVTESNTEGVSALGAGWLLRAMPEGVVLKRVLEVWTDTTSVHHEYTMSRKMLEDISPFL